MTMIDEVYIKSTLLYHGGTYANKLAKTKLAYMFKFLYRGRELITKIISACGLVVNFQLSQYDKD